MVGTQEKHRCLQPLVISALFEAVAKLFHFLLVVTQSGGYIASTMNANIETENALVENGNGGGQAPEVTRYKRTQPSRENPAERSARAGKTVRGAARICRGL